MIMSRTRSKPKYDTLLSTYCVYVVLDEALKNAIEQFHEMKRFTLTGDAPHLGCAIVMFRGDYNDCKAVEKFIHVMKGRPFYEMV